MSYFQRNMVFYPNYLFYHSSEKEYERNFSPSAEPSVSGPTYTNSDGSTSGPLFDLVDNKRNTVCTLASHAGTVTIDIDLTSAIVSLDTVIIDNHTINASSGATVLVQEATTKKAMTAAYQSNGDNVDRYKGGQDTDAMTITSDVTGVDDDGLLLMKFTPYDASDMQIVFTPVGAGTGVIEIGEICLSKSWTPPHAPDIDPWEDNFNFPGENILTPGGQIYGIGNHGSRRAWRLSWSHISQTHKENLQQVYEAAHGGKNPMYFDLGEGSDPYIYYGRFIERSLSMRPMTGGTVWNVSFGLTTDV